MVFEHHSCQLTCTIGTFIGHRVEFHNINLGNQLGVFIKALLWIELKMLFRKRRSNEDKLRVPVAFICFCKLELGAGEFAIPFACPLRRYSWEL